MNVELGDYVFAKIKGYPPWPAQVLAHAPYRKSVLLNRFEVYFFGTDQTGFCRDEFIIPYCFESTKRIVVPKKLLNDFEKAVKEIENEIKQVGLYENKTNQSVFKKKTSTAKKKKSIPHSVPIKQKCMPQHTIPFKENCQIKTVAENKDSAEVEHEPSVLVVTKKCKNMCPVIEKKSSYFNLTKLRVCVKRVEEEFPALKSFILSKQEENKICVKREPGLVERPPIKNVQIKLEEENKMCVKRNLLPKWHQPIKKEIKLEPEDMTLSHEFAPAQVKTEEEPICKINEVFSIDPSFFDNDLQDEETEDRVSIPQQKVEQDSKEEIVDNLTNDTEIPAEREEIDQYICDKVRMHIQPLQPPKRKRGRPRLNGKKTKQKRGPPPKDGVVGPSAHGGKTMPRKARQYNSSGRRGRPKVSRIKLVNPENFDDVAEESTQTLESTHKPKPAIRKVKDLLPEETIEAYENRIANTIENLTGGLKTATKPALQYYTCQTCDLQTTSVKLLRVHRRECRNADIRSKKTLWFTCVLCDQILKFHHVKELLAHLKLCQVSYYDRRSAPTSTQITVDTPCVLLNDNNPSSDGYALTSYNPGGSAATVSLSVPTSYDRATVAEEIDNAANRSQPYLTSLSTENILTNQLLKIQFDKQVRLQTSVDTEISFSNDNEVVVRDEHELNENVSFRDEQVKVGDENEENERVSVSSECNVNKQVLVSDEHNVNEHILVGDEHNLDKHAIISNEHRVIEQTTINVRESCVMSEEEHNVDKHTRISNEHRVIKQAICYNYGANSYKCLTASNPNNYNEFTSENVTITNPEAVLFDKTFESVPEPATTATYTNETFIAPIGIQPVEVEVLLDGVEQNLVSENLIQILENTVPADGIEIKQINGKLLRPILPATTAPSELGKHQGVPNYILWLNENHSSVFISAITPDLCTTQFKERKIKSNYMTEGFKQQNREVLCSEGTVCLKVMSDTAESSLCTTQEKSDKKTESPKQNHTEVPSSTVTGCLKVLSDISESGLTMEISRNKTAYSKELELTDPTEESTVSAVESLLEDLVSEVVKSSVKPLLLKKSEKESQGFNKSEPAGKKSLSAEATADSDSISLDVKKNRKPSSSSSKIKHNKKQAANDKKKRRLETTTEADTLKLEGNVVSHVAKPDSKCLKMKATKDRKSIYLVDESACMEGMVSEVAKSGLTNLKKNRSRKRTASLRQEKTELVTDASLSAVASNVKNVVSVDPVSDLTPLKKRRLRKAPARFQELEILGYTADASVPAVAPGNENGVPVSEDRSFSAVALVSVSAEVAESGLTNLKKNRSRKRTASLRQEKTELVTDASLSAVASNVKNVVSVDPVSDLTPLKKRRLRKAPGRFQKLEILRYIADVSVPAVAPGIENGVPVSPDGSSSAVAPVSVSADVSSSAVAHVSVSADESLSAVAPVSVSAEAPGIENGVSVTADGSLSAVAPGIENGVSVDPVSGLTPLRKKRIKKTPARFQEQENLGYTADLPMSAEAVEIENVISVVAESGLLPLKKKTINRPAKLQKLGKTKQPALSTEVTSAATSSEKKRSRKRTVTCKETKLTADLLDEATCDQSLVLDNTDSKLSHLNTKGSRKTTNSFKQTKLTADILSDTICSKDVVLENTDSQLSTKRSRKRSVSLNKTKPVSAEPSGTKESAVTQSSLTFSKSKVKKMASLNQEAKMLKDTASVENMTSKNVNSGSTLSNRKKSKRQSADVKELQEAEPTAEVPMTVNLEYRILDNSNSGPLKIKISRKETACLQQLEKTEPMVDMVLPEVDQPMCSEDVTLIGESGITPLKMTRKRKTPARFIELE